MPTAYVTHAEADRSFIQQNVLRVLPSNGYDYWLSRYHLTGVTPDEQTLAHAIDQCRVILAVLSPALVTSDLAAAEIDIGLRSGRTLIAIQIKELAQQAAPR